MRMSRQLGLRPIQQAALPDIMYTGASAVWDIVVSGTPYRVYRLETSGLLTVTGRGAADLWVCGGGRSGACGTGGVGGRLRVLYGADISNLQAQVVIGAGGIGGTPYSEEGGATSIGSLITSLNATIGSGGGVIMTQGGAPLGAYSQGGGMTTYPFGDTVNFDPHCAGGGSGGARSGNGLYYKGPDGATNGANSEIASKTAVSNNSNARGLGGNKGGGNGGWGGSVNGTPGTYYGAGGGGGFANEYSSVWTYGANGYQGVAYLRIAL